MDGRDIGTCVLPDADLKIYLTASSGFVPKEGTGTEGKRTGLQPGRNRKDIIKRDHQDMNREHSPLKQAQDAVLLDSSEMSAREVIERILMLFEERKLEERS